MTLLWTLHIKLPEHVLILSTFPTDHIYLSPSLIAKTKRIRKMKEGMKKGEEECIKQQEQKIQLEG